MSYSTKVLLISISALINFFFLVTFTHGFQSLKYRTARTTFSSQQIFVIPRFESRHASKFEDSTWNVYAALRTEGGMVKMVIRFLSSYGCMPHHTGKRAGGHEKRLFEYVSGRRRSKRQGGLSRKEIDEMESIPDFSWTRDTRSFGSNIQLYEPGVILSLHLYQDLLESSIFQSSRLCP